MIDRSVDIGRALRQRQRGFLLNPYRFGAGTPTDPNFANVVLLLHGQGSNGGTTFTDSSAAAHTPSSVAATAVTSTAAPKWGTAAMNFTSGRVFYADHADWDMGSGDFTCEAWVYYNSTGIGGRTFICGQVDSSAANGTFNIGKNVANALTAAVLIGGSFQAISGSNGEIALSTWYHVALCRVGTSVRLFRNGTQTGSTLTVSGAFTNQTNHFAVGGLGDYVAGGYGGTYGDRHAGQIQDFRLTKGVGRYSTTFTAPTAQFPDS